MIPGLTPRNRISHVPLIRLVILCSAICANDSICQSTSPISAFAGNWKFTFTGGVTGNGTMTISPEEGLSINLSLGKYQHLFTNPISVSVSNNGTLHADILLLRLRTAVVIGIFSSTGDLYGEVSSPVLDIGSVTGHLTSSTGSGTYQSVAGNGTWSAQKE